VIVYFRGDPNAGIPVGQRSINIQRRDRFEKGWEQRFPFYA